MGGKSKGPGRLGRKALAVVLTLAVASTLSYSFAQAMRDSAGWRLLSARAVVNPTFREEDLGRARVIPDFSLKDRSGHAVRFSEFADAEVVLVNIWATSCPACEHELPSLMELDKRLGAYGKVALITITTDENWEAVEHLFPYGTDLRVLFDPDQKVTKDIFGTTLFPETFILDNKRRVRVRFDGEREWHTGELLDFISSFKS